MLLSDELREILSESEKPKTYADWLRSQNWEVTQEDYASHKHLLTAVMPLVKDLERFLREHGGNYSFPTSKFSKEDMATLSAALRILKGSEIAMALLKIKKPKPSPLRLR